MVEIDELHDERPAEIQIPASDAGIIEIDKCYVSIGPKHCIVRPDIRVNEALIKRFKIRNRIENRVEIFYERMVSKPGVIPLFALCHRRLHLISLKRMHFPCCLPEFKLVFRGLLHLPAVDELHQIEPIPRVL